MCVRRRQTDPPPPDPSRSRYSSSGPYPKPKSQEAAASSTEPIRWIGPGNPPHHQAVCAAINSARRRHHLALPKGPLSRSSPGSHPNAPVTAAAMLCFPRHPHVVGGGWKPDITLAEIEAALAERGVSVSSTSILR